MEQMPETYRYIMGQQDIKSKSQRQGWPWYVLGVGRRLVKALRRPKGISTERYSMLKSCRKAMVMILDFIPSDMGSHWRVFLSTQNVCIMNLKHFPKVFNVNIYNF